MKKSSFSLATLGFIAMLVIFTKCGRKESNISNINDYSTYENNSNDYHDKISEDELKYEEKKEEEPEIESLFTFSSQYRYKNSFEDIKIHFIDIELVDDYKGILPEREAFLMFHIKYSAPFIAKSQMIYLPPRIEGPNLVVPPLLGVYAHKEIKEYRSINDFGINSVEKNGNSYDLATLINCDLGYIDCPEPNNNGYVSANEINFVSVSKEDSDLERMLIFDVYKKDALNPENYLVYDPKNSWEDNDHPLEKIYFYDYLTDQTK